MAKRDVFDTSKEPVKRFKPTVIDLFGFTDRSKPEDFVKILKHYDIATWTTDNHPEFDHLQVPP